MRNDMDSRNKSFFTGFASKVFFTVIRATVSNRSAIASSKSRLMRLIISNKQGFPSKESVEETLRQHSSVWETYSNFPNTLKQELIGFCTGKNGLKITYDLIFQKIFNPYLRPERLEAFRSAILGRTVRIIRIIPREGTRLSERASFVVMDILIQLDDGSYANVKMQKIGYNFPPARADCYASDIIMRQHPQIKAE